MRTILRDLGSVSGVRCGYVVRNGELLASTFTAEQAAALAACQDLARGVAEGLALVDRDWEEVLVDLGEASLMVLSIEEGFTLATLAAADANVDLLRVVMQSSVRQIRTMLALPPPVPTPVASVQPSAPPQPAAAAKPESVPSGARPAASPQQPAPTRPAAAPQQQAAARPAPQQPAAARPGTAPQQPTAARPGAAPPQQPAAARPAAPTQKTPIEQKPAAASRPASGQKPSSAPQKPAVAAQPAAAAKAAAEKPASAPPAQSGRASEDASPLLPKILELLTGSIGPVARVTFKRGVSRWKESHTPTVGNLPSLVEILAADLSSDEERRWFVEEVERLRR